MRPLKFSQISASSSFFVNTVTLHLDVINVMKALVSWPLQAPSQTPGWTLRRVTKFSHWSPSLASCSRTDCVTGARPRWPQLKFEVQSTQGQREALSTDYVKSGGTTDSRKSDGRGDIYRLCTFLSFNTQTADVWPSVGPAVHLHISCSPLMNGLQHHVP